MLTIPSCTRKSTAIERLAILPANVLVSDPASEWLKLGVPVALQQDLKSARTLIAGVALDESAALQGGATRILRTSVENRNGGLHLESTAMDASTHKVVSVVSAEASSASVLLPALNTLAKKLDDAAIEFPTRSSSAWQAFATAEGNNNPQQRAQFLNQAISLDQNFGLAWVSLIEMIVPARQADLKHIIDEAKAHRAAFTPYDRAKFDIAMNRLTGATPADQSRAEEAALALAPNDLDVMTDLGSNQILQGEAQGGERSLRRASGLNPANVGPRVQLARGLMELRKYKEAETIFMGIDKVPAVLPDLATCVLLQGDNVRADTFFEKFVSSVQNEELKPLLRAAWQVMAGNRQQGVDLLAKSQFKTPAIAGIALSETAVWELMGGDLSGARKTVGVLGQPTGSLAALPTVVALLADRSSTAADWRARVMSAALPEQLKPPTLAYGFFLRANYEDAVEAWQKINDASHGTNLHARVMLASSLEHAGKPIDRIVILPFTPEFTDLYSAIPFTEMRRLLKKR